jgi:hypothetical protein
MKKGRSNIYTTGLSATIEGNRQRKLVLFEIDELDGITWHRITAQYAKYNLDVVIHRSGMGWHWISPTEVTLQTWMQFMDELKDVNKKCPMQTLRLLPNKYPNEDKVWYMHIELHSCKLPLLDNNKQCVMYLNAMFKTTFEGNKSGSITLPRYPLPLISQEQYQEVSNRINFKPAPYPKVERSLDV